MVKVRIYPYSKVATQSGKAKTSQWILEYMPRGNLYRDPLMGWVGERATQSQKALTFPNKDAAVAYAEAQGLSYTLVTQGDGKPIIKSYGDRFRPGRYRGNS